MYTLIKTITNLNHACITQQHTEHNSQIFTLYLLHEHQHHVVAAAGQCLCGCIQQPDAMVLTTKIIIIITN